MTIFEEFKAISEKHIPMLYKIIKDGKVHVVKGKKRIIPAPNLILPHKVTVISNEKSSICVVLTHFENGKFIGIECHKLSDEKDIYLVIMMRIESIICPIEEPEQPARIAISGGRQMVFSMEKGEDIKLSEKASTEEEHIFNGNIINQIIRMIQYE